MADKEHQFNRISISIASPDQIKDWAKRTSCKRRNPANDTWACPEKGTCDCGEIKKAETINYRSFRPENQGLFCESTFGPQKDFECSCGKYKRIKHKGLICDQCGVEVTKSQVRRERLGYIKLATPVSHIWFFKGIPSRIGTFLELASRQVERVLYFEAFIVTEVIDDSCGLAKKDIITEIEMEAKLREHPDSFRAGTGAEAIQELLREINLPDDVEKLTEELEATSSRQKKMKLSKQLRMVAGFNKTQMQPEWMILDVLPVISPDLRPLVSLEGGRFATSDLNDLYRRVINRNNRLQKLIDLRSPEVILRNEKRMLQESVDAFLDNGRHGRQVTGPGKRALKSLSDILRGKVGRFRQNLLGKRVDYSGRSVIVVGPELELHQCGLPKLMAVELFKPFIIEKLLGAGHVQTIKRGKYMTEHVTPDSPVWEALEEVIADHPVLLNRPPTLHRLGIQAFMPVLVEGKSIRIPPLVCKAFNADFDGDQMAVHVPLSIEARTEAKMLLLSSGNILKPSHGEPITVPELDMILGSSFLTKALPEHQQRAEQLHAAYSEGLKDSDTESAFAALEHELWAKRRYTSLDEVTHAHGCGTLKLHDSVLLFFKGNREPILTTVGRVIFNEVLPYTNGTASLTWKDGITSLELPYFNEEARGKPLSQLVKRCFNELGTSETVSLLDRLQKLSFEYATRSGISPGIQDYLIPNNKSEILNIATERIERLYSQENLEAEELENEKIRIWYDTVEKIEDTLFDELPATETYLVEQSKDVEGFNPVHIMADSGARARKIPFRQISAIVGLKSKQSGEILSTPIQSSYREGLDVLDYFTSTYGSRKGLVDTAMKTAASGYLTRKLVDVAQDVMITEEDCDTTHGILKFTTDAGSTGFKISGRVTVEPVTFSIEHYDANTVPEGIHGHAVYDITAVPKVSDGIIGQVDHHKVTAVHDTIIKVTKVPDDIDGIIGQMDHYKVTEIPDYPIKGVEHYKVTAAPDGYSLLNELAAKLENDEDYYESEGWRYLSRQYREKANWQCEQCGIDLNDDKHLLDVHHQQGLQHNSPKDLAALCIGCHADQYGGMHEKLKDSSRYQEFMEKHGDNWQPSDANSDANFSEINELPPKDEKELVRLLYPDGVPEKGKELDPKEWKKHSKALKGLEAEHSWCITEINNLALKKKEVIPDAEYQKALKDYQCPVKVDDKLTPEEWKKLDKTWEGLKADCFWKITEVNNLECSLKVGEVISNAEYQKARNEYQCPVKVGDQLTPKEWKIHSKTWPGLKSGQCPVKVGDQLTPKEWKIHSDGWKGLKDDSFWKITEVNNLGCSLKVGDVISDVKYQKARNDYQCPKIGEELTPEEWKIHSEAWEGKGLESERFWRIEEGTLLTPKDAERIEGEDVPSVRVRSILTCEAEKGTCATCYGADLTSGHLVNVGEAIGIIAAQSIGEPGTQLTMRTFHTGGAVEDMSEHLARKILAKATGTVRFRDFIPGRTVREEGGLWIAQQVAEHPDQPKYKIKTVQHPECKLQPDELLTEKQFQETRERYPGFEVELIAYEVTKVNHPDMVDANAESNFSLQEGQYLTEQECNFYSHKLSLFRCSEPHYPVTSVKHPDTSLKEGTLLTESEAETWRAKIRPFDGAWVYETKKGDILTESEYLREQNTIAAEMKYKILTVMHPDCLFKEGDLLTPEQESQYDLKLGDSVYTVKEVSEGIDLTVDDELTAAKFRNALEENKAFDVQRPSTSQCRVTHVTHPNCPLKVGELIKLDKLGSLRDKFSGVTADRLKYRITAVHHADCKLTTGILLTENEKKAVLKAYPGFDVNVAKNDEAFGVERLYRVAAVHHSDFPVAVDELITQSESNRFRRNFKGFDFEKLYLHVSEDSETEEVLTDSDYKALVKQHREMDTPPLDVTLVYHILAVHHVECTLTVGERIDETEYKRAQRLYKGFDTERTYKVTSVTAAHIKLSVGDILSDADYKAASATTSKNTYEVTTITHPNCTLAVGQKLKDWEYTTALEQFPGVEVDGLEERFRIVIVPSKGKPSEHLIPSGYSGSLKEGQKVTAQHPLAELHEKTTNLDIVAGIPRVTGLFEARPPKRQDAAEIAEIDGYVQLTGQKAGVPQYRIVDEATKSRLYSIPDEKRRVDDGDWVEAGHSLTDGYLNPHDILAIGRTTINGHSIEGEEAVWTYLVDEVQTVYGTNTINDKHVEVIVRQMLQKIRILSIGDTEFYANDEVPRHRFHAENRRVEQGGGVPATGKPVLQSISKASLSTESFISAASFQETRKVLSDAAVEGQTDLLRGLKENVILGRLIPAGTGFSEWRELEVSHDAIADPEPEELPEPIPEATED
jgi:DNA-directed RNA polymerase beta' subunit